MSRRARAKETEASPTSLEAKDGAKARAKAAKAMAAKAMAKVGERSQTLMTRAGSTLVRAAPIGIGQQAPSGQLRETQKGGEGNPTLP